MRHPSHTRIIAWTVLAGFLNLALVVSAQGMIMSPADGQAPQMAMLHSDCPAPDAAHGDSSGPGAAGCADHCDDGCGACYHGVAVLTGAPASNTVRERAPFVPHRISRLSTRALDPSLRPPQDLTG